MFTAENTYCPPGFAPKRPREAVSIVRLDDESTHEKRLLVAKQVTSEDRIWQSDVQRSFQLDSALSTPDKH